MSLIRELAEIDRSAKLQGSSLSQVLAFAARAGAGVDVFLRRPVADVTIDPSDADTIEELQETMAKLAAALAALTLEAQEQRDQLAGVVTYVRNVPNIVAAAVSDALAKQSSVNEDEAAAAIDAARQSVSDATDGVLAAIVANTPAAPTESTGNATAETPVTAVEPEVTGVTGATETAAGVFTTIAASTPSVDPVEAPTPVAEAPAEPPATDATPVTGS